MQSKWIWVYVHFRLEFKVLLSSFFFLNYNLCIYIVLVFFTSMPRCSLCKNFTIDKCPFTENKNTNTHVYLNTWYADGWMDGNEGINDQGERDQEERLFCSYIFTLLHFFDIFICQRAQWFVQQTEKERCICVCVSERACVYGIMRLGCVQLNMYYFVLVTFIWQKKKKIEL